MLRRVLLRYRCVTSSTSATVAASRKDLASSSSSSVAYGGSQPQQQQCSAAPLSTTTSTRTPSIGGELPASLTAASSSLALTDPTAAAATVALLTPQQPPLSSSIATVFQKLTVSAPSEALDLAPALLSLLPALTVQQADWLMTMLVSKGIRHEPLLNGAAWKILKTELPEQSTCLQTHTTQGREALAAVATLAMVVPRCVRHLTEQRLIHDPTLLVLAWTRCIELAPYMPPKAVGTVFDALRRFNRLSFTAQEAKWYESELKSPTELRDPLLHAVSQLEPASSTSSSVASRRRSGPNNHNHLSRAVEEGDDLLQRRNPEDVQKEEEEEQDVSFNKAVVDDYDDLDVNPASTALLTPVDSPSSSPNLIAVLSASLEDRIVELMGSPLTKGTDFPHRLQQSEDALGYRPFDAADVIQSVAALGMLGVTRPDAVEALARAASRCWLTPHDITALLTETVTLRGKVLDVLDPRDEATDAFVRDVCQPLFTTIALRLDKVSIRTVARDDPKLIIALRRLCETNSYIHEVVPTLWDKIRTLKIAHKYTQPEAIQRRQKDRYGKLGQTSWRPKREPKETEYLHRFVPPAFKGWKGRKNQQRHLLVPKTPQKAAFGVKRIKSNYLKKLQRKFSPSQRI